MEEGKQNTQWHSIINLGIRIELEEYADNLQFEEEHKLGTGSKSIDLLIRKRKGLVVNKNIGRIFRGHNLFEVKGLTDYVSIDSFYRACGYGLFYKANTPLENMIDIEDITFSFVTKRIPIKLIKHVKGLWGLDCVNYAEGIYYLQGSMIPIQLIITSELNPQENLWLQSLLNPVKSRKIANELLLEYKRHKGNCNYEDVMQQIVRQNTLMFKKEETMCQALDELIEEGIQERIGLWLEQIDARSKEMEARSKEMEAKSKEMEAKSKEIDERSKTIEEWSKKMDEREKRLDEWKKQLQQQAKRLGVELS